MAEITISYAHEAAKIAAELIKTIDDHKDLKEAEIAYLFTSQALKDKNRVVLGKTSKPGAVIRFFASGDHESVDYGPDFILLFPRDQWDNLSDDERVYLVDHELTHCYKRITVANDGGVKESWALRAHDIEEFHSVIKRRGLIMPDAREFAQTVRQMPLTDADGFRYDATLDTLLDTAKV